MRHDDTFEAIAPGLASQGHEPGAQVQQLYAMPLRELVDDLAAPRRKRWPGSALGAIPHMLP